MHSPITALALTTLQKAQDIFNVHDVSMEVIEDPGQVIPETGTGGYTPDSHTIYVYYDSNNEHFKKNPEQALQSTVMHEFHHTVRNRAYNWKEDTLLGAMVTEGLADHFDLEVNGGEPKPWSIALKDGELGHVRAMAAPIWQSRDFSHDEWFFGSEEKNIPRWTGYVLGFKLVGEYLQKTGKKASELVHEPAQSFIE